MTHSTVTSPMRPTTMLSRNPMGRRASTQRWVPALLWTAVLTWACCGQGATPAPCPESHAPLGSACVPIFHDCLGPAERPVLGGGCQRVGVQHCGAGFREDGEGGCTPLLPPEPCPPGTMEQIGQTACQPLGVLACAAGFVPDGTGGCEPVLPSGPEPCPFGTMEVLGQGECQPISHCGAEPWGDIVVDGSTVFVDTSADATGADGSQARPFVTLQEAYVAATPGGQIALAAGDYSSRLIITKPLRISGRCAEMVTLRGQRHLGEARPPVTVISGGSGTTLRGLTLTGPGAGLRLDRAEEVLVTEVQVRSAGSYGVVATGGSQTLHRVVVAENVSHGVFVIGGEMTITSAVIRDSVPETDGRMGRGVEAQCDSGSGRCSRLTLSRSLVARHAEIGVLGEGSEITITGSLVRDVRPNARGEGGRGIQGQCDPRDLGCGHLTVTGSVVTGATESGISIVGTTADISDSVIGHPGPGEPPFGGIGKGRGVNAECGTIEQGCGQLHLSGSLLAGNRSVGLYLEGVPVTMTGTIIRDTWPTLDDDGWGVIARCDPSGLRCGEVDMTGSLVEGNQGTGMYLGGMDATVQGVTVRGTRPDTLGENGVGMTLTCDERQRSCGTVQVSAALVEGNTTVGIYVGGPETSISGSVVRGNLPQPGGIGGRGINAECHPGSLRCGRLEITGSLVEGNAEAGIFVGGPETWVIDTVVRDTEPSGQGRFGAGIVTQCYPEGPICGRLEVLRALVAGNVTTGILAGGPEAGISGTLIRDTRPCQELGNARGISAQCGPDGLHCGRLEVNDSLVTGSRVVGVYLAGIAADLSGVAIVDTRSSHSGPLAQDLGQGIFAACREDGLSCGSLSLTGSLVLSSVSAGVALKGVSGSIRSSAIRQVSPRELDGRYGYGVQAEPHPAAPVPTVHVFQTQVSSATLAGILFVGASGSVNRSEVSGGDFSVVMNVGSRVFVTEENALSGLLTNEASWQSLEPSPAPPPTLPYDL